MMTTIQKNIEDAANAHRETFASNCYVEIGVCTELTSRRVIIAGGPVAQRDRWRFLSFFISRQSRTRHWRCIGNVRVLETRDLRLENTDEVNERDELWI